MKTQQKLVLYLICAIGLLVLPWLAGLLGQSWVRIVCFCLLYIMLALGLNIVVGFAGLLDLGYIAFYALGAYLYALLASPHLTDNFPALQALFPNGLHTSVWLALPLAAALAALGGVVLGAPTLKLRGDYLAIVTLGFGEIIRIFMNNLNQPINLTNGPQGINMIEAVSIGPLHIPFGFLHLSIGEVNFSQNLAVFGLVIPKLMLYYYLFLTLALLVVVVCVRLQDSRLGRAWVAIREDEIAARAMGINTRNIKLLAFALGASFGGISGAMFAAFQGFVSPESFSLNESILVVAMVVLGGIGHIPGVILGAVLLYTLPEVLRHYVTPVQQALFGRNVVDAEVLRQLLFGLAMVGIMLYRPRGLWPKPEHGQPPAVRGTAAATEGKA